MGGIGEYWGLYGEGGEERDIGEWASPGDEGFPTDKWYEVRGKDGRTTCMYGSRNGEMMVVRVVERN